MSKPRDSFSSPSAAAAGLIINRVMWPQDYPHSEGTFGYTSDAVKEVMAAVTPQDARNILGGTAAALYGLT